ncbi:MAG: hypothetical protein IKA42_04580 [Clostridia bacterium]|nr:hypothetical protein [Clostridia bacterium]
MSEKKVPNDKKISKTKYLILISIFSTVAIALGIITCIYDNVINTYCDDMYKWEELIKDHRHDGIESELIKYPDFNYLDYINESKNEQNSRRNIGYILCGLFAMADAVFVTKFVLLNRKKQTANEKGCDSNV